MEDVGLIHEDHLQRVIGLLRASYTHLVLDLSKSFSPTDVTALRMADVILLVAQLELTSLRNVVRMLLTLGTEDEPGRQGARSSSTASAARRDISLKKAEETIGKPIFWQVPNDPKAMIGVAQRRRAAVDCTRPRARLQQSIAGLAEALCGKDDCKPAAKEKSSRWGLVLAASNSRQSWSRPQATR